MNRNMICVISFLAGVLLAGSTWAGENPHQGSEARNVEQPSDRDTATIISEAAPAVRADGALPVKEAVIKEESAPKVESVPKSEDSPKPESAEEEGKAEETVEAETIADPIEPVNRVMYLFNDRFYFWALKPVARGYNAVLPEPARVSVRSFFKNVKMPIRFVNTLLQGKFKGAGTELARFGINTTIGVVGLFDVAKSQFDLDSYDEDFGQTLGFYGVGGLMYIVWPILGPSTLRDTIGMAGDSFLNPVNYINPFEAAFGVSAYEQLNKTSLDLGTYEDLKASSVEPYIGFRDAYIQHRNKVIKE